MKTFKQLIMIILLKKSLLQSFYLFNISLELLHY